MVKMIFIGKQTKSSNCINQTQNNKKKISNIKLFHCAYDTEKGL